jgi:hypothetical protein
MILVAAGDSFVWGSELKDSPHGGPNGYSHNTFTALLSGNNEYVCAAYPGNANNAISRMAIDALATCTDTFLIATWTYPQRAEFRFGNTWASVNSWHTTHKEFSESYFKYAGNNEYYEIYSLLKEVVYLQHYCKINNIPYLFLTADNHFYQHANYTRSKDTSLDTLYAQVNWDNWFWFPAGTDPNETLTPRGFYQWAVENKYIVGPQGHPLEKAHQDAAILIKEKFDELVAQYNQSN